MRKWIIIGFVLAAGVAIIASCVAHRQAATVLDTAPTASPVRVTIAFWNIRDLSMNSRDSLERARICAVLDSYDAIAICEINDAVILGELEKTLEQSGQPWSHVVSPRVGNSSGSAEHYGVLFREAVFDLVWDVQLSELVLTDLPLGWELPGAPEVEPGRTFDREPYAVALATDDAHLDFVLLISHVAWGERVGPRVAEVRALSAYYNHLTASEPDVLVVGDFNRNAGDPQSLGWLEARTGLIDTTDPAIPTIIDGANTYDHIMLHPAHTIEYDGVSGVDRFDEIAFANDDVSASLICSDHRPVWIQLAVPGVDDD